MRTPNIKLSLIVFLFAALSACATPQVSRTTSFGSESQTALFVMGVDVKSPQFRNPHFRFRQFDPPSMRPDNIEILIPWHITTKP